MRKPLSLDLALSLFFMVAYSWIVSYFDVSRLKGLATPRGWPVSLRNRIPLVSLIYLRGSFMNFGFFFRLPAILNDLSDGTGMSCPDDLSPVLVENLPLR